MGVDFYLEDPVTHETIEFDQKHEIKGGTYAVGGCHEAWLKITYNYSKFYYRVFPNEQGLHIIDGMSGAESIPILKDAISKLGDDVSGNYWDATEGNAKRALLGLLAFAQLRPDGIWRGSW